MYTKEGVLLSLNDISLSFGDNLVLRDISFEIKDIVRTQVTGQIGTIVGKSGVGKSKILEIIAGLLEPTSGCVKTGLDQHPVIRGEVGMVAQNYPLFEHRTLNSNLKLVCKDQTKIDYFLNEFNLFDKKNLYPKVLSGGQRQRGAIVQQLLCSEHMILFDEPFSGLDPIATEKLCDVILKVANMDSLNTILITSHIIEPALAISDSLMVLGHEYKTVEGQKDPVKVPGAIIRYCEDLAARGLAWRKDIKYEKDFIDFCKEVEKTFKTI